MEKRNWINFFCIVCSFTGLGWALGMHPSRLETKVQDIVDAGIEDHYEGKREQSEAGRVVLDLLQRSIQAQEVLEQKASPTEKVKSFLPQVESSEFYVEAYQKLGNELRTLSNAKTHSTFFADYSKLLLRTIESFSTEKNWSRNPTPTAPYEASDIFSTKGFLAIRKTFEEDSEFLRVNSLQRNELFAAFKKEIETVETEKRAHYEWFTLFTNRIIFLATSNAVRSDLRFWSINTGFSIYGTLIDYLGVWKSEKLFRKFLTEVGDDITIKIRSPLALAQLFPATIMIPYPFAMNGWDLIQFSPAYPTDSTNTVPIGFPFLPEIGDGSTPYIPSIFFTHDYHHLAIDVLGQRSFASRVPLSIKQIEDMYNHLREKRSVYTHIVKSMKIRYQQEMASTKIEPGLFRFFRHLLFEFFHETAGGVTFRLSALVAPDFLHYTDQQSKRDYVSARRFFNDPSTEALASKVKQAELAFKAFVQESLTPDLSARIARSHISPSNVIFTAFGTYTTRYNAPRAASLRSIFYERHPYPIMELIPKTQTMYGISRIDEPVYYYFFPRLEQATLDLENSWVIRFGSEKQLSDATNSAKPATDDPASNSSNSDAAAKVKVNVNVAPAPRQQAPFHSLFRLWMALDS